MRGGAGIDEGSHLDGLLIETSADAVAAGPAVVADQADAAVFTELEIDEPPQGGQAAIQHGPVPQLMPGADQHLREAGVVISQTRFRPGPDGVISALGAESTQ